MRKIYFLFLFFLISYRLFSQNEFLPSPNFLTIGYQTGYGYCHIPGNDPQSYSPTYPFISIEGFLKNKFYYHFDFTTFLILGLMSFANPNIVLSNSSTGNKVLDIYSPIHFSVGKIKMSKNGFLMPFGFELTALGINSISVMSPLNGQRFGYNISDSNRADLMYSVQYFIFTEGKNKSVIRFNYAIGANLHSEIDQKIVYKFETSMFVPIDKQFHFNVSAFYLNRTFVYSNTYGLRIGLGYNW